MECIKRVMAYMEAHINSRHYMCLLFKSDGIEPSSISGFTQQNFEKFIHDNHPSLIPSLGYGAWIHYQGNFSEINQAKINFLKSLINERTIL